MTITLQAVNELIASLESAGELSIKETKVMELAKAYVQLAAENVALALENVAMKQIVDSVTNLDNEPQYHDEGMGCGLEDRGITDRYDACRYGWDEAIERIYGEVIPCADELDFSATDRIVAGIKAEAKSHDLNAFISHYSAELDTHIANGGDQFDERAVRLRGVIVGARMFREKLREEEKATPGPWEVARDGKTLVSNQSHPIATVSDAMHRMLADGSTGKDAEFIALANPANILALVNALEKAQQYAKERDAENQDLMLTVGRLRVEREELESRTVKLPKKNIGWDRDEDDCWNNAIDACAESLTAAGIKVEAE